MKTLTVMAIVMARVKRSQARAKKSQVKRRRARPCDLFLVSTISANSCMPTTTNSPLQAGSDIQDSHHIDMEWIEDTVTLFHNIIETEMPSFRLMSLVLQQVLQEH